MIRQARRAVLSARLSAKGQSVVITAGVPLGVPGTTNLIKAEKL
jgi:pyruvate kinase